LPYTIHLLEECRCR